MALGRGLGDILEEMGRIYENELDDSGALNSDEYEEIINIDVDKIDPNPYQPRKKFDEERLNELAQSIQTHGLIQPIVVLPVEEDRYIVVAGERRLRAHKIAGIDTIRAIVPNEELDEKRLRELALIENIQREDLNPIELAKSYKELIDVHGITHEELAKIVHKSRSQITNTLRLLVLDDYTLSLLSDEKISQGHAKILVSLDEKERRVIVDTIINQKLSVRDSEKLVQKQKHKEKLQKYIYDDNQKDIFKLNQVEKRDLKNILKDFNCKISDNSVKFNFDNQSEYDKFVTLIKKLLV